MNNVFSPADILLPKTKMDKWAVIACDQFSSQREYWDRVAKTVGDEPSTLHMVVPEAYLSEISMEEASKERNKTMEQYVFDGVFRCYENSYIYVEREVSGGKIRRGLLGKLDLEAYDYTPGSKAAARASEKTVVDRLPPRIRVRAGAGLELPHILVLIDDEKRSAIEPLSEIKESLEVAYDFDLMEEGGHITGYRVNGDVADRVTRAIDALGEREVQFVIGDGNHSLAAAKNCWNQIRETLSEEERKNHPARFALVELCNVYDEGIVFEPIHRIVFNCDPKALLQDLERRAGSPDGAPIRCLFHGTEGQICIQNHSLGSLIGAIQEVLDEWEEKTDCTVDYIHDEKALTELAKRENSLALFLPPMAKEDLFQTVERDGVFPKKSFSIGHARDKRYYLECRKIK